MSESTGKKEKLMDKKVKIAAVQLEVKTSREDNVARAGEMISRAAENEAQLIILPEMFNCPYVEEKFPLYAEKERGETWQNLATFARENSVFLVAGSVPELADNGRVYNTSYIFNDRGEQLGKHRKVHLCDIELDGGYQVKESKTLNAGEQVTVVDTPLGKLGVMICYDIRFPELSRAMVLKGAEIIIVPAAFNMTTGPVHWELLFKMRAIDNQVFTIGVGPARTPESEYTSYGNSIVVDPWGRVLNRLGGEEGILYAELDLRLNEQVRRELPLLEHRRPGVYGNPIK